MTRAAMTSTPGSDAERGLEAEERHEQARQQGAEEEYDAVHGTDRGVHAPLDAVVLVIVAVAVSYTHLTLPTKRIV